MIPYWSSTIDPKEAEDIGYLQKLDVLNNSVYKDIKTEGELNDRENGTNVATVYT